MLLPERVTPDLINLHRRFSEIFQAYFRHLVASGGDTRLAFVRARANGDLILGDISHCLEIVEDALRRESGTMRERGRSETKPHPRALARNAAGWQRPRVPVKRSSLAACT
ncbi:MAG: hypothetical protein ACREMP_05225 [Candidatus Tyrphobacter sp.]